MTPRQVRRATKRLNRKIGATAAHFSHLRIAEPHVPHVAEPHFPKPHVPHVHEPHLLGAHPLHSSHFHVPTGASLTPHVPHVRVSDPIHLRIHPTRSLGSGIAHDIKKIGGSIERDVRKVERKVF